MIQVTLETAGKKLLCEISRFYLFTFLAWNIGKYHYNKKEGRNTREWKVKSYV